MSGVVIKTVTGDEAEMRLDRWFKKHHPELSHGRLEKLLRTGQVRVDGKRVKASQRLEPGNSVRVPPLGAVDPGAAAPATMKPRPIDPRAAQAVRGMVLFQDDHVIALDKPAGLAVQGGHKTKTHVDGMLDALAGRDGVRPKLVHRLDRDTSGVLLLARTAPAARALAKSFQSRDAKKIYWALVTGVPKPPQGRIALALAKREGRGGEKMDAADDGKPAVTYYATLDMMHKRAAWLALWPRTGRTHQLRVHMAEIGHPILGDGKYGGQDAFLAGAEVAKQVHLHARRLILPHPAEKGLIDVTAPTPTHLKASLDYFGFLESDADPDPFAELDG